MKFALLGMDRESLALVRALLGCDEHHLAAVYDVPSPPAELLPILARSQRGDSWESLLHGTVADAVIVGRGGDSLDREDQLRKLVQAKIPLLVVHPACSSIIGYELEMIRRDTAGVIMDYFPGKGHPALSELSAFNIEESNAPLGRIEQIVVERSLTARDADSVLAQLARDAQAIRTIVGRLTKISAIGGTEGDLANLSVQMTAAGGAIARWSVTPAIEREEGLLQVIGTEGRARLNMPEDVDQWRLQIGEGEPRTYADGNSPRTAITAFSQRVAEGQSDWLETCRDIEVAETAQRSARRGRTYELFYEEHKEEDTFKGLMAVGGCAVLLLGLLLWVAAGVVEGIYSAARPAPRPADQQVTNESPEEREAPPPAAAQDPVSWWRYWPVCPFALFLILQLLWLVFRPPGRGDDQVTS